ncbi:MAG: site-specific DNA-methyltransferase [Gammaproteobacteria bacterium]|uniref:Methyltransferase n=1 Tax=Candidatus Kutchimonas denitrificans TaxID=3056748 RepID=A0AAE4ZCH4_9BACT|nr:site-specific DNA-methyltransferase [Candidatus Kutchimonas denitrificans]NIV53557.1 site-specific DNA-methyltransferase [Gammaproteobacteria bacterium]
MEPYYEDEAVKIYHGDCLEVLLSIEAQVSTTVTDPPFSSGARTDAGKSMRPGAMLRSAKWDDEWFSHDNMATVGFLFLMRLLGRRLFDVTALDGSAHVFIDWRQYPNLYGAMESAGWVAKNLVVWDKGHFGMGSNYRNQHELILYAEKTNSASDFNDNGVGNVLKTKRPSNEWHPTEKPSDLIQRLITASTTEGATVLDPFMGSGTTLVAAKSVKRKAIGIEIEERYCEIAAERCSQGVLNLGGAA